MISVNPQGNIYLCKTPLENDYANQLTFANATAQQTYFNSTVVKTYDNNTYIRKDGGIKIEANAEDVRQCNYMFYKNTGFDNRIYYCFITEVTYLSENSTFIFAIFCLLHLFIFSFLFSNLYTKEKTDHYGKDA